MIGAGIAGPATAIALQKARIEARVFEAHAGAADDVGVFLTLASNGFSALRVIDAADGALGSRLPHPAITLQRRIYGHRVGWEPA